MQSLRGFQAPSQELEASRFPGPADHQKNGVAAAVSGPSTRASDSGLGKSHASEVRLGPIERLELAPGWQRGVVLFVAFTLLALAVAAALSFAYGIAAAFWERG